MQALRRVATLFDSAIPLPGLSYRIGLDPLLGLIPVVGELVSPLFGMALLWQARDLGIPKVVQLRMLFNIAIDALIGIVPIAGDLFDFAWKANDRNMTLLERHAHEEHRPSPGDWLFVLLMMGALLAIAAIPFLLIGAIIAALRALFS